MQFSYQVMLDEAIAIVVAPKYSQYVTLSVMIYKCNAAVYVTLY